MKNTFKLGAALLATTLAFTACGDDSSSSSPESDEPSEISDDRDNSSSSANDESKDSSNVDKKYNATFDEKNNMIIVSSVRTETYCATNKNGSAFKMKTSETESLVGKKYEFKGDTLILYDCLIDTIFTSVLGQNLCIGAGEKYVGGKKGKLQGTWESTNCSVSSGGDYCIDTSSDDPKKTITIGEDFITQFFNGSDESVDVYIELSDLSESDFMSGFYVYLLTRNDFPKAGQVLDSFNKKYDFEDYGIKTKKKNPKNITFTYSGATFNVDVAKAERTRNTQAIELSVTVGKTTCNLDNEYIDAYVSSKEICNIDNKDYFIINHEKSKDAYVANYSRNNSEEFQKCIDKMLKENKIEKDTSSNLPFNNPFWDMEGYEDYSDDDTGDESSSSSSANDATSSSSENDENDNSIDEEILSEYTVDEDNQTIVFKDIHKQSYCLTDKDHSTFEMREVSVGVDKPVGLFYSFFHDTLAVRMCDNYSTGGFTNGCDGIKYMFVGGEPGNIYGTWKYTGCFKPDDLHPNQCQESFSNKTFEITKNDLVIKQFAGTPKTTNFDLENTSFMEDFITFIAGDSYPPSTDDLFYEGDAQYSAKSYGIPIKNSTKSSLTLVYKGTDIDVEVEKITKNPFVSSIVVSSGERNCKLVDIDYSFGDMAEDVCNASNKDDFKYKSSSDSNKDVFYFVDEYSKDNYAEFEECINEIIAEINSKD